MARTHGSLNERLWRDTLRKIGLEYAQGKAGPRKVEVAARAMVKAAMEGDIQAGKEFGDRLDGKPHQTQDVVIEDNRSVIRTPEVDVTPEAWQQSHKPH